MMKRRLWHTLFGHLWELVPDLPMTQHSRFDIDLCKVINMETHYSKCPCGMMLHGYSMRLAE